MECSIIIPCYNNEKTVVRAVESALANLEGRVEVVVVDDGSTDNSLSVLKPYRKKIKIYSQENRGACVARNYGLAMSSGRFVKFLDADDILHENCLEEQCEQLRNSSQEVIVYGKAVWLDGDRIIGCFPVDPTIKEGEVMTVAQVIEGAPLTSCPLHRREWLLKVKGWNPDCLRGQEYDLHVRMALHGARFVYRNTFCYWYVQHGGARISSGWKKRDVCENQLKIYDGLIALAKHCDGRDERNVMTALARLLWKHGRLCSIFRYKDLARSSFRKAQSLSMNDDAGIAGKNVYRKLVQCLDPYYVERILLFFRKNNL